SITQKAGKLINELPRFLCSLLSFPQKRRYIYHIAWRSIAIPVWETERLGVHATNRALLADIRCRALRRLCLRLRYGQPWMRGLGLNFHPITRILLNIIQIVSYITTPYISTCQIPLGLAGRSRYRL